jgi:hypothetical protein
MMAISPMIPSGLTHAGEAAGATAVAGTARGA